MQITKSETDIITELLVKIIINRLNDTYGTDLSGASNG